MRPRRFLDRVALAWILIFFPATSLLALHHRPIGAWLSGYHWIVYAAAHVAALFGAWCLVNWGGQNRFYIDHPWRRKLVAGIALPAALVLAGVLFPLCVEGKSFPGPVVILFFCVLIILLTVTGFVGTREHPVADCGQKDLEQAARIHISCLAASTALVAALGTAAFNGEMRKLYVEIWHDIFLMIAAGLIVAAALLSFVIYPWLVVRSMQQHLEKKKPPSASDSGI